MTVPLHRRCRKADERQGCFIAEKFKIDVTQRTDAALRSDQGRSLFFIGVQ